MSSFEAQQPRSVFGHLPKSANIVLDHRNHHMLNKRLGFLSERKYSNEFGVTLHLVFGLLQAAAVTDAAIGMLL